MATSQAMVGQEVELVAALPQHGLKAGARGVVLKELGYWDLVLVRFDQREIRLSRAKLRPVAAVERPQGRQEPEGRREVPSTR